MTADHSTATYMFDGLSAEEEEQARENLRSYLRVVVRIYEHVLADSERYEKFVALTQELERRRMSADRSNITSQNQISEA